MDGAADANFHLLAAINTGNLTVPGIEGEFLLGHSWRIIHSGNLASSGRLTLQTQIPNMNILRGIRLYLQVVVGERGQGAAFTNLVILDIAD